MIRHRPLQEGLDRARLIVYSGTGSFRDYRFTDENRYGSGKEYEPGGRVRFESGVAFIGVILRNANGKILKHPPGEQFPAPV